MLTFLAALLARALIVSMSIGNNVIDVGICRYPSLPQSHPCHSSKCWTGEAMFNSTSATT
jgi:hypothetical protein